MTTISSTSISPNNMTDPCDKFTGRRADICRGIVDLPLETINTYRAKWGLPPLEHTPLTFSQRAVSFIKVSTHTIKRAFQRKPTAVSQEVIDARLASCKTCSYYSQGTCLMCGCACTAAPQFLNKLAHASSECPIGRWGKVQ